MSTLLNRAKSIRDSLENQEKAQHALVAELARRDVALRRDGDRLIVSPWATLPADLRERVRAHKAELLRLVDERDQPLPIGPVSLQIVTTPVGLRELVELRADGIALTRRADGILGACVGWHARDDQGRPLVERTAPTVQVVDPRPDLDGDSAIWLAVLSAAYGVGGHRADGVYAAEHGMRCLGAQLRLVDEYLEVDDSAVDVEDRAEVNRLLLPWKVRLTEMLPTIVRQLKGAPA